MRESPTCGPVSSGGEALCRILEKPMAPTSAEASEAHGSVVYAENSDAEGNSQKEGNSDVGEIPRISCSSRLPRSDLALTV